MSPASAEPCSPPWPVSSSGVPSPPTASSATTRTGAVSSCATDSPAFCCCRWSGDGACDPCAASAPAGGCGSACSRRSAWSASTCACSPPNARRSRPFPGCSSAAPRWWWPSSYPCRTAARPGVPPCTAPCSSPPARAPSRAGAVPTRPASPSPRAPSRARPASRCSRCPCCARSARGCCRPPSAGSPPWSRRWPEWPWTARRGCGCPTAPRRARCSGRRRSSP